MSFRSNTNHLSDILTAIADIRTFVEGMSYEQYLEDRKTRSAVERELLIISEAAYRLAGDAEILCPGLPWHEIRAIGNVLRHGYHSIHDERIWTAVQDDLTPLRIEVEAALARVKDE